jgi:hypothetical protein
MAKKDKKKKDSPQDRGREIVDELAKAVGRIREELSQRNISDDLKGLRGEVESLARRVAALEVPGRGSSSSRSTAAAKPAASRSTAAKKPAASRSTAARKPAASRSTAARKPAASRSTAAKKPAASRSTAAKKPAASRSRSTTTRSRSTSTSRRSSGSSS